VPELRLVAYLRDLALLPESAKELRVFGFVDWLLARHGHTWRAAMEGVWQRRRKIAAQMPAIVLAALTLALVAVAPIARGILSGEVDAGHAVVLIGALAAIIGLGGFLPEADFPIRFGATALPAVAELEARLTSVAASARPQTVGVPAAWREVSFRDVTFRYPGGDEAVLDRLDLTIRRGETVAIVGANGAGKTTLTKLLAGLYDPCSGSLCVDDVDLADIDVAAWRRTFAVIFQDFVRFELSARDNVGFGSVHLLDDTVALERVAERAAISSAIHALPLGWDSPLARSYTGGADLSGGQWQRVALARALLAVEGGASLLVLDEPTASLDVRAEAEFYDRFVDLERGTTTVLISHRFSTVRRADRICVLEGGRVTEDGTHDELLGGGGRYAEMFRLQAARFG
jgi:ATP-binding cassette, subfamily B, bacterial